ncbi:hypothetical protein G7Z17_g9042 [Cylindrodendrum hubeiense]|uniref:Uncharacterized protein n=1 Tax=Cylindrodendrum hubeiense TaxID=595255 RepID=A0A9P5L610_9HYPO|nr:hypothetical protein G7Z17_g9042 [Cylindrodendrum hubeiense]
MQIPQDSIDKAFHDLLATNSAAQFNSLRDIFPISGGPEQLLWLFLHGRSSKLPQLAKNIVSEAGFNPNYLHGDQKGYLHLIVDNLQMTAQVYLESSAVADAKCFLAAGCQIDLPDGNGNTALAHLQTFDTKFPKLESLFERRMALV